MAEPAAFLRQENVFLPVPVLLRGGRKRTWRAVRGPAAPAMCGVLRAGLQPPKYLKEMIQSWMDHREPV